ncbi:hypothetical protein [uncultured Bacteroides sp.]|uniref:hypothetical protein n=1 Tax=uncultured Bacteroides sp. TaxID=162156 RepID=UPI0026133C72|nr:hypothetical protein [uncultured Bacteroides sp.]
MFYNLFDIQRRIIAAEELVMKFHNDEMLIDVRFSLRVNGLLKPEFITGLIGGQAVDPIIGETLYFFRPLTVFNENPVSVQVSIGYIDIHGNDTCLNFVRQARCEDYHRIFSVTVTGAVTASVNLA